MPINLESIRHCTVKGVFIGAVVGFFGSILAANNFLGLLFVPCILLGALNNVMYTDAGPSNLLFHILFGVTSDAVFGACIGCGIGFLWYRKPSPRPGHCSCGYNLTGNLSGTCPECGEKIQP